jgi:hypothetical protein
MLSHRIANHFAAAEAQLVTVTGEVAFDLDDQVGVSQPQAIARCGAVEPRVLFA